MAINFGGTLYAWNSGQVIALFVVSGFLFIAFGIQQKIAFFTTTSSRMFPVHFFKNKEALLLFVLAASCNACVFVAIYYIPIYFQFTRQDTALDSAVRLLPLIFMLSFTILLNGFMMSKLGYYQPWYVCGSILAIVASVLLCKLTESILFLYISTNILYSSYRYEYSSSKYLRLRNPPWSWNRSLCSSRLRCYSGGRRSYRHVLRYQLYDDR